MYVFVIHIFIYWYMNDSFEIILFCSLQTVVHIIILFEGSTVLHYCVAH